MKSILAITIIVAVAILAIGAFIIAEAEKKARKDEEKIINEIKAEQQAKAERVSEIITEANKTKADARTGDHSADIKYMADKLHHYANE